MLVLSCEKEVVSDDPSVLLIFSADTVLFDTIFTSFGSATRHFKVYNQMKKSLEISRLSLSGGESSPFRMNVDGIPGSDFNNIVIRGGDSMYVFVEATIDPLEENSPMVVEDSVVFVTNGNVQDVKLVAWGQDVNIIKAEIFDTRTLAAGKPYLVYEYMMVDTGHVLRLEPGVRLHFHRNSRIYVAGSLIAEGDYDNPVVFEGARTESVYRNIPGQWDGIWLLPGSSGNRFINARIRNAVNGILVDTIGSKEIPTLYLANSRIENMTYAGIIGRGAAIYSYNTIISNCGYFAVALTIGGNYTFYHCTFANYWNISSRRTPSILIENYYIDIYGNVQLRPVNALFGNCIIHGSQFNEIEFSFHDGAAFDVVFDHCLLENSTTNQAPAIFSNCINVATPGFIEPQEGNYRLAEDSAAIDAGDPEIGSIHPFDHEGKSRPFGDGPDIGAFERHNENE